VGGGEEGGKEPRMNDVLHTIKNRRTIRKFKPDPIEEEKLQMILEA
jgi:nitroreductase